MRRNSVLDHKIPVSVVVVTRNEAVRLPLCLGALRDFSDVWVVDSGSEDETCNIARDAGAKVQQFVWDGAYPKKRGWCLAHLELAYDWVFFVDADEVVTADLVDEIAALDLGAEVDAAGYFIKGRYIWDGRMLRFGLCNNKLALFDRRRVEFPVIDDLGLPGMGEIEGHYQPVLKAGYMGARIGQLRGFLQHNACDDKADWEARHLRYAAWEAGMNARRAWPDDPVVWRRIVKRVFRALPFRGAFAFVHCYVWKLGVLDGARGFDFAVSRGRYYGMIQKS